MVTVEGPGRRKVFQREGSSMSEGPETSAVSHCFLGIT